MARPKRYSLAIELTGFCNQKCGYCYNGWREDGGKAVGSLPGEALLSLVDRALTDVEFDHVTLTGGEPFARPEVFDVLEVVGRHGLRANIISNGGLITDAIAERLAPHRPHFVQISLNGPDRALHREHVGSSRSGEDPWDATLRGIGSLKKHGVAVAGCVVVTRKNARVLGEILDLFLELGVTNMALSRFSPAGFATAQAAELLPSRSDMLEALDQAEVRGRDHGMDLSVTMPIPPCVVEHALYPHLRFGGCPIGTENQELVLGPTGELRNCTLHEEVIGDARTTSLAELIEAPAVARYRDVTPEFCAPCPHRRGCLGGCGAAADWTLGERGLDPFVAQHVDEAFGERLRRSRADGGAFVPAARLVR